MTLTVSGYGRRVSPRLSLRLLKLAEWVYADAVLTKQNDHNTRDAVKSFRSQISIFFVLPGITYASME